MFCTSHPLIIHWALLPRNSHPSFFLYFSFLFGSLIPCFTSTFQLMSSNNPRWPGCTTYPLTFRKFQERINVACAIPFLIRGTDLPQTPPNPGLTCAPPTINKIHCLYVVYVLRCSTRVRTNVVKVFPKNQTICTFD